MSHFGECNDGNELRTEKLGVVVPVVVLVVVVVVPVPLGAIVGAVCVVGVVDAVGMEVDVE